MVGAFAVRTQDGELWVSHGRTDLAALTPAVDEARDHEAAAARRLGHHLRQGVQAPTVLHVWVAQALTQV